MARERAKDPASFSVEEKLKNLYQLQTKLSEIDKIKAMRGELPLEVQDLEDEVAGLTLRMEKISEEIKELEKDVSVRNGNIAQNAAEIERYKAQMDEVRNNREYDSLPKQVEYKELDTQLNEKKIREAKELIELKRSSSIECTQKVADLRDALALKREELDEIVKESREREDMLREEEKNLELTIEPRLLAAFKRIRKNCRNGLGIVYVQRDACGGCFNKIPPQRQLDIRMRKKIIVCEYCGRIMIDPELAGVEVQSKNGETKTRRRRTPRKRDEE